MLTSGYPLRAPLGAFAVGEIVASRNPSFREGELVRSRLGFRDIAISDGRDVERIAPMRNIPLSAHLSVLGMTGFTAWGGLLEIARLREGERVFVSTAAGAVGSVAIQIARNLGCEVAGSTGSESKATWLRDVAGIANAIDYRTEPLGTAIDQHLPEGIDVYFDNVGGDQLDIALTRMRLLGRVAVCGMISAYNAPGNVAPVNNLASIIYRRVSLRGFTAADFEHRHAQFLDQVKGWIMDGRMVWEESVTEGLEKAPAALIGVLNGANLGKALVRIIS